MAGSERSIFGESDSGLIPVGTFLYNEALGTSLGHPRPGMSLHEEKAAALAEVLAATGEPIVWKGRTLHALVSDNPLSQDLGLGGFEAKGDCTMKLLRSALGTDRPRLGETVEFQSATYRITRVTDHPQFPMVVLVAEPVD